MTTTEKTKKESSGKSIQERLDEFGVNAIKGVLEECADQVIMVKQNERLVLYILKKNVSFEEIDDNDELKKFFKEIEKVFNKNEKALEVIVLENFDQLHIEQKPALRPGKTIEL